MFNFAIEFTSSCLQQCLNWFHALMNSCGVTDGAILGFFAVIGVSSLIIMPLRGRSFLSGSDVVQVRSQNIKYENTFHEWHSPRGSYDPSIGRWRW